MPECKDCRHYRPAAAERVPIHSLRWLTSSPQAAISQEFKRIAEEERASKEIEAKREKEYEQKAATLMATHGLSFRSKAPLPEGDVECFDSQIKPQLLRNRFNEEPRATTHCAVHSHLNAWHLPSLKNWGERCKDFQPRQAHPDCQTCDRYEKSDTEVRQRADARALMELTPKHDQSAGEFFKKRAEEIEQAIDPAKAQEMRVAYDLRGRLRYRLSYLPTCGIACERHQAGGPQEGCSCCVFRQPEIFNQFLGCEDYIPAQRRETQPSGGSGKRIPIERRETEVDRIIGPPRPIRARDEAVQMIEEALTAAAQKVAGPANQAQQIADRVITSVFQQIRERVNCAQEREQGEKKCARGHVNAADRRTCAVCGQRL